jgi:hypothetical protein
MKNKCRFSFLMMLLFFSADYISAQSLGGNQHPSSNMKVRYVDIDSMRMSDPFILADPKTKTYYMTGSGGNMWKSNDLKIWQGPFNIVQIDTSSWMGKRPLIWAAELHSFMGYYYYYFATFTNSAIIVEQIPGRYNIPRRASHVLISNSPDGPYKPISSNNYTPEVQSTLDGTLWVEDGAPYLVYCREWLQTINGTIDAVRLSADLSKPVGTPFTLFKASDGPWSHEMTSIGELTYGKSLPGQVTDGPFLFKTQSGKLGMLWSSWGDKKYAQGVAYSASGKLNGPWIHEKIALNSDNSGHGMMFHTFNGILVMCLHTQNSGKNDNYRKPKLLVVDDSGDKIKILGRFNP